MQQFLDEAVVIFESGHGGNGSASFHREKYVPLGGPNGSDGGRGGDVTLVADHHVRTLYDLRLRRKYKAGDGVHAIGNKDGKDGKSVEIKVPIGTIVTDVEHREALVDLNVDGMKYVVCVGGKGGYGNLHFTNSVRQAPTIAQNGARSEVLEARLELKLIADVGLVGLPNAGKSTFLSSVTAAKPKIASYPFTTLEPNLGVVKAGDGTFVMADLPGLIEGASEGHGLGHQFLKHAERTRVLIHIVDGFPIDGTDPIENFRTIESELAKYSEQLKDRRKLNLLNKTDTAPEEDTEVVLDCFREIGVELTPISAATGNGVKEVVFAIAKLLDEASEDEEPVNVIAPVVRRRMSQKWGAEKLDDDLYVVTGDRIERMIHMTDLRNTESLGYIHRQLEKIGVLPKLRDLGISGGDTVKIGDWEFEYEE